MLACSYVLTRIGGSGSLPLPPMLAVAVGVEYLWFGAADDFAGLTVAATSLGW